MADDSSTRSWNAIAGDWVAHADTNDYRNVFLLPRMLAWLGEVRGRRILDLGCGEGGYARELARRGADVVAVDGSERLVATAVERAAAEELAVQHLVRNASDLGELGRFDVVLAAMSLMDVEDYPGAIREAVRALAPGGELVMSVTHPCFQTPGARWLRDETGALASFTVDRYFDRAVWPERLAAGFAEPVLRRHAPLEDLLAAPLAAGLVLRELVEPRPTADEIARAPRLERLLRVPYFLFLRWARP